MYVVHALEVPTVELYYVTFTDPDLSVASLLVLNLSLYRSFHPIKQRKCSRQ